MASKAETRRINIYINDKDAGKSIQNIKSEARKLNRVIERELTPGTQEYEKAVKRLSELKGTVKNHREQIKGVQSSWDSIKTAMNPIAGMTGLAMAGAAAGAVIAMGQHLADVSKEYMNLRREIQQTSDLVGAELARVTIQSTALSRTFGDESNEVFKVANSVANEMKISIGEALTIIEKGYIAGGNANGEMLEQIREYIPVAKEIGLSAEGLTAQIVKASKSGEFSDYGIAAIEEAQLRLREMPKSTVEALNKIGLTSKEIKKTIAEDGIGGAIEQVSKQMSNFENDSQEMGTALAGIFGAAGEKVGVDYILSLEEMGGSLDGLIDKTDNLTQMQIENLESQKALAEAENELSLEIENLIGGQNTLLNETKAFAIDLLVDAIRNIKIVSTRIREWYQNSETAKKIFAVLNKTIFAGTNIVIDLIRNFGKVPAVFAGVQAAAEQMGTSFTNALENMGSRAKIALAKIRGLYDDSAKETIAKEEALIAQRNAGKSVAEAFSQAYEKQLAADMDIATKTAATQSTTNALKAGKTVGNAVGEGVRSAKLESQVTKEMKAATKAAEREAEKLAKRLEKLNDNIAKLKQKNELGELEGEAKEVRKIEIQYQSKIDEATELEATEQLAELERLKQEAIKQVQDEYKLKKEESDAADKLKKDEAEAALKLKEAEEKAALEEEIRMETSSALDNELFELEAHYARLTAAAEKYGIDTTEITARYEAEKEAIEEDFRQKGLAKYEMLFDNVAGAFSNFINVFGQESEAAIAFQKGIAIAQIGFDTAKAISSVIAAAASTSITPIDLAIKVAAGIGTVLGNVAQAKKIMSETTVPQRFTGGMHSVKGATDGKSYNAQYLGQRNQTGMLPPGPKLILANEKGPEYFVDADTVRNPLAFNHIAALETLAGRQMQDGGLTDSLPSQQSSKNTEVLNRLIGVVEKLSTQLEQPIKSETRLNDDTLLDIKNRTKKIDKNLE